MAMAMAIGGRCRCGSVGFEIAMETAAPTYACHCRDCQTWSGSAFAEHFMIPESLLSVSGPLTQWAHESEGGAKSVHHVCATCHTRIFNTTSAAPGLAVVRAGALDDSNRLTPIAHIWTSRKQGWISIPEGAPSWPETPTPEEFALAVAKAYRN